MNGEPSRALASNMSRFPGPGLRRPVGGNRVPGNPGQHLAADHHRVRDGADHEGPDKLVIDFADGRGIWIPWGWHVQALAPAEVRASTADLTGQTCFNTTDSWHFPIPNMPI